jgi:hypothetical protein
MAAGRAEVGSATLEPDPELVVVFDLAGTVEEFARVASRVGMEFLTDADGDEYEPDDDFHVIEQSQRSDRPVHDSLYLAMSNAQAVTELISLFDRWQADPKQQFARGLNPWRQVFAQLRAVRRWGAQDRVRETGLLEQWAEDLAVIGQSGSTRVEIELWYRADPARRASAQDLVDQLVTEAGGRVVTTSVVDAVDYHAVLADLPYPQVEAVLTQGAEAIALLTTDTVMFISPAKPMAVPALELAGDRPAAARPTAPTAAPRVALLDGLPLANHTTLAGRVVVDDPDDIAAAYTAAQTHHGTAMASLIAHGDLNDPQPPLSTRIYARPILQPHPLQPDMETVLRDELLVDLVHRALRRIFDGDGHQPPAAPSVRIVNLSIGDPARVFDRRLSPLAKLLDWVAHRYNLLILVSGGNHPITTAVPAAALKDPAALRRAVTAAGYDQARQRRLLSPAEGVNVITVGALHADAAPGDVPDTVIDTTEYGMPALYSPVGFGHRRSIKPEILLPGGRSLHQRPPGRTTDTHGDAKSVDADTDQRTNLVAARTQGRGPGLLVAAPGHGELDATAYSYGTSNATALATRTASQIVDVLEALRDVEGDTRFPAAEYHPILAKTLLVHAASWGSMSAKLVELLGLPAATRRRDLSQLLGYGAVDSARVATASRTRVLLLGAGTIRDGERHTHVLPLPGSLLSTTDWRRLTITLGWLSPVNTRTRRHRMARLEVAPPQSELGVKRVQADSYAVKKGTLQHEVLEGQDAVAFAVGTGLGVNIDCRVDASRTPDPEPAPGGARQVRYGIAVSLEMATSVQADIHAEVRQALRDRVGERVVTRA